MKIKFKDFGFYTESYSKNKLWSVLHQMYPNTSLEFLENLVSWYYHNQDLPEVQTKNLSMKKLYPNLISQYSDQVEVSKLWVKDHYNRRK